jgi:hypothetical protein
VKFTVTGVTFWPWQKVPPPVRDAVGKLTFSSLMEILVEGDVQPLMVTVKEMVLDELTVMD